MIDVEYIDGYMRALYDYAWMKDGIMYVGSCGTTYKEAKIKFINELKTKGLTNRAMNYLKTNFRKDLEASIFQE